MTTLDAVRQLSDSKTQAGLEALEQAVCSTIAVVAEADLWNLFRIDNVSDLLWGDASAPSSVVDALLERAVGDTSQTTCLALLTRLTSYNPGLVVHRQAEAKSAVLKHLKQRQDMIRPLLHCANARVRVTALHLLSLIPRRETIEDAVALGVLDTRTSNDVEAFALQQLALARLKVVSSQEIPSHRLAQVMVGITSLKRFDRQAKVQLEQTLLEALAEPEPLPLWWGMRWHDDVTTDATLIGMVFNRFPKKMKRSLLPKALPMLIELEVDNLKALCFPGTDGVVSASDLTEVQRAVLPHLDYELSRMGIGNSQWVDDFLNGTGPWTSVVVDGDRMAAVEAWRGAVFGELDVGLVVEAFRTVAPETLFTFATHWSLQQLIAIQRRTDDDRSRHQEILTRVISDIHSSSFDIVAAYEGRKKRWGFRSEPIVLLHILIDDPTYLDDDPDTYDKLSDNINFLLAEHPARATDELIERARWTYKPDESEQPL